MKNYKKSEVMKMAWQFVKMYGFSMSEGLVMAWRNIKLRFKMYEGVVKFTFKKLSGETRHAWGTLKESLMPETKGCGRRANNTVQTYFDQEKGEWRSYKLINLLEVA